MVVAWIAVLAGAGLALIILADFAWRRRRLTAGAASFGPLILATAFWCLTSALELGSRQVATKMFWVKVQYVAIVTIPLLWLVFVLQYTGRGRWLSRRNCFFLALPPFISLLVVWTQDLHRLFWTDLRLGSVSGWSMLHVERGPAFLFHGVYSYLYLAMGTLLLVGAFMRASPLHRGQVGVLLLGALLPWLSNALYLVGYWPWRGLDPTPLAFSATCLVAAFGLFRFGLLQITPVACRAVIESLPAAMIVLDAEDRIVALNPATRRLFGLTDKRAIGQPARRVLTPVEIVDRWIGVRQANTEVELGQGQSRQLYRLTISPLDDGSSGPPARLVLISDITEQELAREGQARRSRHLSLLHDIARAAASTLELPELYQALANTLGRIIGGDGCAITCLDVKTGREVVCASYGLPEAVDRDPPFPEAEVSFTESVLAAGHSLAVEDVFHSPHVSPRIAALYPARSLLGLPLRVGDRTLGVVLIAFDDPHTFDDKEIEWAGRAADLCALAVENARLYKEVKTLAGELEQRVITRTRELERAQADLLYSEKLAALGRLSAGIAHEIGHPLSLIHGYVGILAGEQPDLLYLSPIQRAIEQLASLLSQLRNFARPSVQVRELIDVNLVVESVLSLADRELIVHHVQVCRRFSPDLPAIVADAQQLSQVFLNLVLNACDAMPHGGVLRISTFCQGAGVTIAFEDSGEGIAPENLERLFEPYFTTKKDKGTGLGLPICRQIVEAHGGQIQVSSVPGAGSTFQVFLPRGVLDPA